MAATTTNTTSHKNGTTAKSQFLNPATGHYIKRDTETGQILGVKKDGMPYKGVRVEKRAVVYKPNPVVDKATARKAEKAVLAVLNRRAIK